MRELFVGSDSLAPDCYLMKEDVDLGVFVGGASKSGNVGCLSSGTCGGVGTRSREPTETPDLIWILAIVFRAQTTRQWLITMCTLEVGTLCLSETGLWVGMQSASRRILGYLVSAATVGKPLKVDILLTGRWYQTEPV